MDFQLPSNPSSQATLQLLSANTIRVTAYRGQNLPITWSAGQHMFLALPSLGPVESHPFTIATIANDDCSTNTASKRGKEMVWIIRARDGFTKRMRDHIIGLGGQCQLPVFMHGPYGAPQSITSFSTCIFIAGEYFYDDYSPMCCQLIQFRRRLRNHVHLATLARIASVRGTVSPAQL